MRNDDGTASMIDRPDRQGEPLLVLDRVAKNFGEVEAVRGIDLEIGEGEFVAIMGPSGCGKTTTLRMLAGLEQPTRGELRHRGRRINDDKPWNRGMPMVWQNLALFPFLDVLSNVGFGLKMAGVDKRERTERSMEWLRRMGIDHLADRDISKLSGGQLQRVALARALVTEPDILLLDEPLSALDAHLVVRMQSELTQLQRQLGITFVYVTHNQSEAFAMADRVIIMNEGLIEQIGEPREVYRRPCSRFVAEFVGTNNLMTGTVKDVAGGIAAVETAFGPVCARLDEGPTPPAGQEVTVVVSADIVRLRDGAGDNGADGEGGADDENVVHGTLISEEFVGTVVTLHLDVGEEVNFRVQVQQNALERMTVEAGRRVSAAWSPRNCFILPDWAS